MSWELLSGGYRNLDRVACARRCSRSLTKAGFLVSLRPAGIRVSSDFYITEEEVDRFLRLLAEEAKRL